MSHINRLNKKLKKEFNSQVYATEKDGCVYLSGSLVDWKDVVKAGKMSVNKKKYLGVINDINFTGDTIPPMVVPDLNDNALEGRSPDVLIIGAGIIGASIARELSKWDIDILLVDKENDVSLHASGRNDGMIHPGIDLKKGQVKQHYNSIGNRMFDSVCSELGVPFKRTGQYVCFDNILIKPLAYLAIPHWKSVGISKIEILGKRKLLEREPALSQDIKFGIFFPSGGIVCPYSLTIAYAENAVENGVKLSLNTAVTAMDVQNKKIISVTTNRGTIYPKIIINAAGVFAEDIAKMAHDRFFSIHPRRGTNSILDKKAKNIINTVASKIKFTIKKSDTKGGGIVSTVDNNVLVGPDAVETYLKEDFSTFSESISATFKKQGQTTPLLSTKDIITYFTGVRAPTYEEDFVICKGKFTSNIIHAAGIQSPGLTAAPAIALDIEKITVELLSKKYEIKRKVNYNPIRRQVPKVSEMEDAQRDELIKKNPDYGIIVCRCEEISKGEIIDVLNSPVPCTTLDGVKRRVRPGMGRCQGGFCSPLVARLISQKHNIPLECVLKSGEGSSLLLGKTKGGA